MKADAAASGLEVPTYLGGDQVHLWLADLDIGASRRGYLLGTLTEDERARASRFRFERDRTRFIAARGLLRSILASYLEVAPEGLRFRYGPYGKPYLSLPSGFPDVRFNLSHSQDLALYAVSVGREVGVDLERVQSWGRAHEIAARFFSARELSALMTATKTERAELFFAYWTAKEAYLKAKGEGLSKGLGGLVFQLEPGKSKLLQAAWKNHSDKRPFEVKTLKPAPGFVAALAAAGGGWQLLTFEYDSSLSE